MELRFYIDPVTQMSHSNGHGVEEHEVEEILADPLEVRRGSEGACIAVGKTSGGRFLRVVFVLDPGLAGAFVITAYQLGTHALWALRRRQRRKP